MKVLLVKDEYCTDIYDVSTPEKLYDVAYRLVIDRLEQGFYVSSLPEVPKKPFTNEEMECLPEALKAAAKIHMDAYRHEMRNFSDNTNEFQLVQKVQHGYKPAALQLLLSHSQYDNEEVELKEVLD